MFSKETYMARRAKLKQTIGSGLLLFLGNDESGMNYADNTYHFRQDSTFLYFFGLPYAGLSAIIDIDNTSPSGMPETSEPVYVPSSTLPKSAARQGTFSPSPVRRHSAVSVPSNRQPSPSTVPV